MEEIREHRCLELFKEGGGGLSWELQAKFTFIDRFFFIFYSFYLITPTIFCIHTEWWEICRAALPLRLPAVHSS